MSTVERLTLAPGYSICRVINGCWQLSEGHSLTQAPDEADVLRAFHMLVERGFTTFDVADIYTGAEDIIGRFTKELEGGWERIQVHTKYVPDLDRLQTVTFQDTEHIIDRSLKRLSRDVLDIVQFHWWDYEVPRAIEVAGHLARLQEKGKIRFIGTTNFDTEHLAQLVEAGIPVLSIQAQYSLFDKRPEKKQLPWCRAHGVNMFCYGTLSGGYLSGKYLDRSLYPPETRSQVKYLQIIEDTLGEDGTHRLLRLLDTIAREHGVSISNVAARYILEQEGVAGCIIGTRSSRHVESNEHIFSFHLSDEEKGAIRQLTDGYPALEGDCYTLERTSPRYKGIIKMKLNGE